MINYFCNKETIEKNAMEQLSSFEDRGLNNISVFPDIHYCAEKNLPVGVAFKTTDKFYPLITGKDLGCGVMYLRFKKSDMLKPFNKTVHFNSFDKQSAQMTDDGLGGGNHFLSIEEGDDEFMYIICHTGSRNLGIELYQRFLKMINDFNYKEGIQDSFLPKENLNEELVKYYNSVIQFASDRRRDFVVKTFLMLFVNGYLQKSKSSYQVNNDYIKGSWKYLNNEGDIYGVEYKIQDSVHNHIRFNDNDIIHRKGATELIIGQECVIPLSMTRGSLIVKPKYDTYTLDLANYSCSHGAGRKLSRTDTLKHWNSGMKESERKAYRKEFPELLNKQGDFPKGYVQEFDFAYKPSEEILKNQPYLVKVAQTKPVVTVKFTEI
jgi:tRNA-splicing ligase RtcB/release factor H-coupled RctB family protein